MIQKPKRLLNVITSLYWELRGDAAPVLKHNNALSYLSEILRLAKAKKKSVARRRATPRFVPVTLGASQPLINWVEFDMRVCPQQRRRSASPGNAAFNHLLGPVRSAVCLAPANYGKPTRRCSGVNINPNDAAEPAWMFDAASRPRPASFQHL